MSLRPVLLTALLICIHISDDVCRTSDIVVKVNGPRPENIIFMIHEVFETLILESFHGVSYDLFVPCFDCIKAVSI